MEALGYLAAGCVLLTFCMQSMVALRCFALASNILFILYAFQASIAPIVLLHALLVPINICGLACLLSRGK